ncbi:hypothetical protein ACOMHN_016702 [Nucella lapillus]
MDDLKSEMSLLREELHGEVEQLRSEVRGLRKENEDLAKKVDDLQGRSKRNNIIIHGMMRPPNETSVDCEGPTTRRPQGAVVEVMVVVVEVVVVASGKSHFTELIPGLPCVPRGSGLLCGFRPGRGIDPEIVAPSKERADIGEREGVEVVSGWVRQAAAGGNVMSSVVTEGRCPAPPGNKACRGVDICGPWQAALMRGDPHLSTALMRGDPHLSTALMRGDPHLMRGTLSTALRGTLTCLTALMMWFTGTEG